MHQPFLAYSTDVNTYFYFIMKSLEFDPKLSEMSFYFQWLFDGL